MASELSRVIQALEQMTKEYSRDPNPALKRRIDKGLERKHRLEANIKENLKKRLKKERNRPSVIAAGKKKNLKAKKTTPKRNKLKA